MGETVMLEHKNKQLAFAVLIGMVLFAGIASLLYEVLWIRQLGLSLGSTAVATSVMLSAFLGGLALGSWIISKRADTLKSPFLVLGIVEIAAAIFGLGSIPILELVGRAYVFLASNFGIVEGGAFALRAGFSAAVMLLPAILFGMTFPLATAEGARLVGGQKSAGIVSAVSSFGSALGAAVSGLWLEPMLGIFRSALVGMGLNLIAALLAFLGWALLRKKS